MEVIRVTKETMKVIKTNKNIDLRISYLLLKIVFNFKSYY